MAIVTCGAVGASEATIAVRSDGPTRPVSPYLTGACLEDVNHEVYGGIDSQMVFGESFQEPPAGAPVRGFTAYGGEWILSDGALTGSAGEGPKLVSGATFADGEARVEVRFVDRAAGLAGLILRVARPGLGADSFDGYEVALDPSEQVLRLGRHRRNWTLLRDVPCPVPVGEWITLSVRMSGRTLGIAVDGESVLTYDDDASALLSGAVGLRQWQRPAEYRNLRILDANGERALDFVPSEESEEQISGMWRAVRRAGAQGSWRLERDDLWVGTQAQRLAFTAGEGGIGVENRGLNRWGLSLQAGRTYELTVSLRSEGPAPLWAVLESGDGSERYAERKLDAPAGGWRTLRATLTPERSATDARLTLELREPGGIVLGYVRLQPGEWGRFHGLPVRRDVAEGLREQGITVLRYGGSLINDPHYRWKAMTGPRESRQPYHGTWYPWSSNGWGIPEFVAFCKAAGFLAIPAFNMGETPEDMIDFLEYANGPASSEWGKRRVADGYREPFGLRHIQLGNEERVDEAYAERFALLARAIWAWDPEMILVVGDFAYSQPIGDPEHFGGAAGGITSLAAHRQILALAESLGTEVWFDVHIGTDGPGRSADYGALASFQSALASVAGGAKHRVVVFEFNAGNHQLRRGLANAEAIHLCERLELPVATSANCLQPDGQNDNDWDQGLLFLNPSQVWLQPPGWVTRMVASHRQPLLLPCEVEGPLDANATRSEDGRTLVLSVVNTGAEAVETAIDLGGWQPSEAEALVEELSGPYEATNTASEPERIVPARSRWAHRAVAGRMTRTFPPRSYTVIELR